jgi:non-ribosomal peptide synthetase component F
MRQNLPKQAEVQLLVNVVMHWAEAELRKNGRFLPAAAWLVRTAVEPELRTLPDPDTLRMSSIQQQEAMLAREVQLRWQREDLAAALLAAPVLYGRSGSQERSLAVRLHVESRDGYCADILMPYRIRTGWRWRGSSGNRVHFSHPVAQESDSRLNESPSPA